MFDKNGAVERRLDVKTLPAEIGKDAVSVAVEGGRAAIGQHVGLQSIQVGLRGLRLGEAGCHYLAGSVADEGDQGAARTASL